MSQRWLYDFLIYLYVISLLFAFSNLIRKNPRSWKISFWLLVGVWLFLNADFALRIARYFPEVMHFDPLFLYAWSLLTFTLIIHRIFPMDLFMFGANLLSFTVLAIYVFFPREHSFVNDPRMLSDLVFVHVTLAWMAYAAFSLSAVYAVLYLINNRLLKQKKWNRLLRLLPGLADLQRFSNFLVMIGYLLLLVSLILGSIWSMHIFRKLLWFDWKIFFTFFVLSIYGVYLYQSIRKHWTGKRLAIWNLVCHAVMLGNLFFTHTNFHT